MCNFVKSLMDSGNHAIIDNPFQPYSETITDQPLRPSDDDSGWDQTQVAYIAATCLVVVGTSFAGLMMAYRYYKDHASVKSGLAKPVVDKTPNEKETEGAQAAGQTALTASSSIDPAPATPPLPQICKVLPVEPMALMQVKMVDLSDPDTSFVIDDSWQQLVQIEYLNLSNHEFDPDCWEIICGMKTLKTLVLQHAQLTSVPFDIAGLDRLEDLDLSFNRLTSINFRSQSIATLKLRHNQIKELPIKITKFSSLQKLDLRDNSLQLPASEVFTRMPHHVTIDLRGCGFTNSQLAKIRRFSNMMNEHGDVVTVFLHD